MQMKDKFKKMMKVSTIQSESKVTIHRIRIDAVYYSYNKNEITGF